MTMRHDLKEVARDAPSHVSSLDSTPPRSPGWLTVGLVVATLSILALPGTIPSELGPVSIVTSAVILVLWSRAESRPTLPIRSSIKSFRHNQRKS